MGTHPIFESDFDCLTDEWEEAEMTDFTKPDGYSSWNTIYPVYINSKRTRNEGRRIPVDLCCEDPTINELESVFKLKFNYPNEKMIRENKYHPKAKDKWAKKSMEYSEIGSIKFEFEFLEKDLENGINSKNDLLKILPKLITEYRENLKNSQKTSESNTKIRKNEKSKNKIYAS